MNILKQDYKKHTVQVELTSDELREISNGLFLANISVTNGCITDSNTDFADIQAKIKLLFDLAEHGIIEDSTVENLYKANKANKERKENTV